LQETALAERDPGERQEQAKREENFVDAQCPFLSVPWTIPVDAGRAENAGSPLPEAKRLRKPEKLA
jgi:hypothetical protein